jgi:hypothetical protein
VTRRLLLSLRRTSSSLRAGLLTLSLSIAAGLTGPASASNLAVYMDLTQLDHLKAYGLAYWALSEAQTVEWLLNYRGGSFLMDDTPQNRQEARIRGVLAEQISDGEVQRIYQAIEQDNMERILLEKAPRVAVYVPPTNEPWDDAVTLALEYADIPYDEIWDHQIQAGALDQYDWLHLHHEDFTGQYGKFYVQFHNAAWYRERQARYESDARAAGYDKVWQNKHATVETIREYVARGGFMFAMCSATDTFEIASAARGIDIVSQYYDGDPADSGAQAKLDFDRTLLFEDFRLVTNPFEYEFSDIDVSNYAQVRGAGAEGFSLFEFSAKEDPVPTMLTQCHVNVVKGFLGQTTGYNRRVLKDHVVVLGEVEGTEEVKYVHSNFGKGTVTFYGGHDPEDYQHRVGDPPTDLSLHKSSPGYRLILNNILFPAAEKKPRKT